jgi:hypothetical protein
MAFELKGRSLISKNLIGLVNLKKCALKNKLTPKMIEE